MELIQKNILLTAVPSPPLSGSLWHYSDPSKAVVKRLRAALHQCIEALDSYYVKFTVIIPACLQNKRFIHCVHLSHLNNVFNRVGGESALTSPIMSLCINEC